MAKFMSNIRSFDMRLAQTRNEGLDDLMQKRVAILALEGARTLAQLTPVDRGRAKGNWQFTLNNPASGEIDRLDPSPVGSSVGTPVVTDTLIGMKGWQPGMFIWFHNGVPYIVYLNDGTPKTEAHHMLERTVERLKRMTGETV